MQQLEERRAVPLQVLAVSGQPLVVSMTLPRFPFAKTGSPFATGGPRVRILLPPAVSLRTIGPSAKGASFGAAIPSFIPFEVPGSGYHSHAAFARP
jgi:hypothetical protein